MNRSLGIVHVPCSFLGNEFHIAF